MKAIIRKSVLFSFVIITMVIGATAQRVIKGTVYRNGEPAAGVTVEGHRCSGTFYTSFDGKYELQGDEKTKWLRFTDAIESKKLDIEGNTKNVINFSFDGIMPAENEGEDGPILKTRAQLLSEQDKDFINEVSLYDEFYKQKDYKSALPHWEKIYNKYPKSSQNVYIHGIKMHEDLLEQAATQAEKDKYIDKILEIYDKRIKYFDREGYNKGRKGTFWFKHKLMDENIDGEKLKSVHKQGYNWLEESINEQGDETEIPICVVFMQSTNFLFKNGEISKETVIKNYEKCNEIIDNYLVDNPGDVNAQKSKDAIEKIFGLSGAADCEALVNIYAPQFEENSGDAEFIKSMLRKLNRAGCDESDLFANATEKLYELDPSGEAAFNMARRFLKKDDSEKANEYYKMAAEQITDQELLEACYQEYAQFIFFKLNNYQLSRTYAKKALSINPNNCEALMLIGNIYLQASSKFEGDDFDKATVFWVAVDYFNKARRAGDECTSEAATLASKYKAYFPNKEEGFFRGYSEGQSYTVGGWINETTKVRF